MTNEEQKKKNNTVYSKEEVEKIVAAAVQKALNDIKQPSSSAMQIKTEDYVTLLFLGKIAQGTVVSLGSLGQINRSGGILKIPKEVFLQKLDYNVEKLLGKRKLIVINGLTEEERQRYNVLYTNGELLTENMYYRLLDYSGNEIIDIFKNLCEEHKKIVGRIFIDAYLNNNMKIDLETIKELNKISKEIDKAGLFTPIIKGITKKISEE